MFPIKGPLSTHSAHKNPYRAIFTYYQLLPVKVPIIVHKDPSIPILIRPDIGPRKEPNFKTDCGLIFQAPWDLFSLIFSLKNYG